jgi:hypothetical protein
MNKSEVRKTAPDHPAKSEGFGATGADICVETPIPDSDFGFRISDFELPSPSPWLR